jgi:hypothetical protein
MSPRVLKLMISEPVCTRLRSTVLFQCLSMNCNLSSFVADLSLRGLTRVRFCSISSFFFLTLTFSWHHVDLLLASIVSSDVLLEIRSLLLFHRPQNLLQLIPIMLNLILRIPFSKGPQYLNIVHQLFTIIRSSPSSDVVDDITIS